MVRTAEDVRELYPLHDLAEAAKRPPAAERKSRACCRSGPKPDDGHAWAMVIDAAACIGCNACVVACQAENNVAGGRAGRSRARPRHALAADRRLRPWDRKHPKLGFQPVPCMHCEHAPCEPVCPVAASVHDGEGLNVQVYNRCVGTRFCEANCPYKVRRFNFFGYADGQEYANLGAEAYRAQNNPEVTVRARGVMEKCTYCVQRISAARRAAESDDRPIGDDEVKTACQSACPTSAISFGDLHAEGLSRQSPAKPMRAIMRCSAHLGTRPRTTYLADVRNPDAGFRRGRNMSAVLEQSLPPPHRWIAAERSHRCRDHRRPIAEPAVQPAGKAWWIALLASLPFVLWFCRLDRLAVRSGNRHLGHQLHRSSGAWRSPTTSGGSGSATPAR